MIVGEAPGADEEKEGEPFVGKSGDMLMAEIERNGFTRDQCFITNAVSCRPPGNRTPTKGEIKSCREWLQYQIAMVKPKYVLLLGNTPLFSALDVTGIKKKRGKPVEKDGIIYLPTVHPMSTVYDEKIKKYLEADIRFFFEIVKNEGVPREDKLNLEIVQDWDAVRRMLATLEGTVAYDCETTGLYCYHPGQQVISLGLGTRNKQWCIPLNHPQSPWSPVEQLKIVRMIDARLKDCFLVAHNGKFDAQWMWQCYNVVWHCNFDTMIAHYLIDENSFHGLKYLAVLYYGAPDWEIHKDAKMGSGPLVPHCTYLAHDVFYTRKLLFTLRRMLKRDLEIKRVFDLILMPCVKLFTEIERNGVWIDEKQLDAAHDEYQKAVNVAKKALDKWDPMRHGEPINWGSPQQLAWLLFTKLGLKIVEKTKTGNPSTSESVLKQIDHPCVGHILKWREASKNLSSFLEGWRPLLVHNRLHPSFKLHGTVTGRLSCELPNLQQVPRNPKIRSCISAPPGWTLVELDLSQIELRIAAELANERTMMQAFKDGVDVHWLTMIRELERGEGQYDLVMDTAIEWCKRKRWNKEPEDYSEAIGIVLKMGPDEATEIDEAWKEMRKKAKAINFGYLFGMWWKKFKIYARDNYDIKVTDKEAMQSREAFFDMYGDYIDYHERQRKYAKRHGYVKTLSGRKRRLPDAMDIRDSPQRGAALRQAINSPVQGFANEINLMSLIQLRKEFSPRHVRFVATIHDSILAEVRDDYVERYTRRALKVMQWPDLMNDFEITMRVPLEAEAKIGPWGKGVKLEKWLESRTVH